MYGSTPGPHLGPPRLGVDPGNVGVHQLNGDHAHGLLLLQLRETELELIHDGHRFSESESREARM